MLSITAVLRTTPTDKFLRSTKKKIPRTLLDEVFLDGGFTPKLRRRECQCLLRLTIESRVFDKSVDEQPHMIANLGWLDRSTLVFLAYSCHDVFRELIGDIKDMGAALDR